MTQLAGKRALITGAASGLGRLLAQRLATSGCRLVLWDLNEASLAQLAGELGDLTEVDTATCDVSDAEMVNVSARQALECGPVDILINNAGIVTGRRLLEADEAGIRRTLSVNTLSLFWTTRAFLPGMIANGGGHVVTIASAGGLVGTARLTDYCASKFAAVGFDEALRLELESEGHPVRTTVVCPYYLDTGMFRGVRTRFSWLLPIQRPEPVADRIVAAIRRNRRRLITPRFVYSAFLTRLLPVPVFDWLMDFFGVSHSMDRFTGRSGQS
ncbi:MAG: SDR family oxidoreductase [Gammaproteobacteria bacterium]|jgi:all-trans-retinol dehydrogenase (NAD+)